MERCHCCEATFRAFRCSVRTCEGEHALPDEGTSPDWVYEEHPQPKGNIAPLAAHTARTCMSPLLCLRPCTDFMSKRFFVVADICCARKKSAHAGHQARRTRDFRHCTLHASRARPAALLMLVSAYLVDRIWAKGLHAEVDCLLQALDSAKQLDPNISIRIPRCRGCCCMGLLPGRCAMRRGHRNRRSNVDRSDDKARYDQNGCQTRDVA